jgi:hypothetical protein
LELQQKAVKATTVGNPSRTGNRDWTAAEKYKLKGLAKSHVPAERIARILRRPVAATIAMAAKLGISLDVTG